MVGRGRSTTTPRHKPHFTVTEGRKKSSVIMEECSSWSTWIGKQIKKPIFEELSSVGPSLSPSFPIVHSSAANASDVSYVRPYYHSTFIYFSFIRSSLVLRHFQNGLFILTLYPSVPLLQISALSLSRYFHQFVKINAIELLANSRP